MASRNRPPYWFWGSVIILLLWEAIGVFACVLQLRMGADSWPDAMDYDRRLYLSMPVWYNWIYAVATFGGLIAAVLLALRRAESVPLFALSLIAIVVMFGYVLGATDIIAHKGFLDAAGFPLVIFLLGVFGVWVSRRAKRRGWIG